MDDDKIDTKIDTVGRALFEPINSDMFTGLAEKLSDALDGLRSLTTTIQEKPKPELGGADDMAAYKRKRAKNRKKKRKNGGPK